MHDVTHLPRPFSDPLLTAEGKVRASVPMTRLETLWVNTGTQCNIECANCYIESSPTNDRLVYFSLSDLRSVLNELEAGALGTRVIGFTGGEPFLNPQMPEMIRVCLELGFEVLVLTNALQPMMRARVREALGTLVDERVTMRVSLDHYTALLHDGERGDGAFVDALRGIRWLLDTGFRVDIAGRTRWDESEQETRIGFAGLFRDERFEIVAEDPSRLVLFPEMDESTAVPEVSVGCWELLGVRPESMMCATSRMVVRHRGSASVTVQPCTLLAYEMGMGDKIRGALGPVQLNHRHCARFCVLGGGSCSG